MAQITINIPDDKIAEFRDAFADAYGWKNKLDDGTNNPESKAQHLKRRVIEYMRDIRKSHLAETASKAAREAVMNQADPILD